MEYMIVGKGTRLLLPNDDGEYLWHEFKDGDIVDITRANQLISEGVKCVPLFKPEKDMPKIQKVVVPEVAGTITKKATKKTKTKKRSLFGLKR